MSTVCLFKNTDAQHAFTEKHTKPRENIDALNMDSRSGLSLIKLMEETDVSAQICSFLKVTAFHHDEKPDKDLDG